MNRIDELRETWEKAYRGLIKDLGNKPTLEDLACMFFELGWRAADEHPNGSQIKWQTGEPKVKGSYIITTDEGTVALASFYQDNSSDVEFFRICVTAWCKLSDIEPYKDKEEQP